MGCSFWSGNSGNVFLCFGVLCEIAQKYGEEFVSKRKFDVWHENSLRKAALQHAHVFEEVVIPNVWQQIRYSSISDYYLRSRLLNDPSNKFMVGITPPCQ